MSTHSSIEPILEPALPIIDAHHHLWLRLPESFAFLESDDSEYTKMSIPVYRRYARYLIDEFMEHINTGHNIRATVFVEAHAMLRATGPDEMKSVGEVEFANGTAAMAASGLYGKTLMCAGIIGGVDLKRYGDKAKDIMIAQKQAGGSRYRGIRSIIMYDEDPHVLTHRFGNTPHVVMDKNFRAGFKHLEPLGLSFEAFMLEPQLPDLVDLARTFPGTQIIVNHTGGPVGNGRHKGKLQERFPLWRDNIKALGKCPNVSMKLGGLGMPTTGFPSSHRHPEATSEELAKDWKPYIETCIEAFGADRCMFESNFPPDAGTASYPVYWNAFKRTVSGASASEKSALFFDTAKRIYKLDVEK
jgi:predicted TIM-barrel fold metal-dependent hydrolase